MAEVVRDAKEDASKTFADVIQRTKDYFPDPNYRPHAPHGIHPGSHTLFANGDGTGTIPEIAERLFDATGNYKYFQDPAFRVAVMVADDVARDGHFVVGLVNCLDVNSAEDPHFVAALACGVERACAAGNFPLLNGETAELGYRTPGYGKNHVNWNAVALRLVNAEKTIDGNGLKQGQPIVAFREKSIRSNGLTRARAILERAYLAEQGGVATKNDSIIRLVRQRLTNNMIPDIDIRNILHALPQSAQILESIQLPWHKTFLEITQKLLTAPTMFTPLMYAAQGGVDGSVAIPIIANAHISGGGVPLKAKRMVERQGVGVHLDPVFPDPEGVEDLMKLAEQYPDPIKGPLVNERSACEQWNRGVGFLSVVQDASTADALVQLAECMGYQAAIAGETIAQRKIEWRGHTWDY